MENTEATPQTESAAAPAAEPTQQSFETAIEQAAGPSFTQADLDAKLAESQKAWEAEHGQKYGWAKDIDAADGAGIAKLYADIARDPVGTLTRALNAAGQNPANHAAINAYIASLLPAGSVPTANQSGKQDEPAGPPGPDLVIPAHVGADGQIVPERRLYSAEGMAAREQWLEQKFNGTLDEKLKPLTEFQQQQQQASQQAEYARQADEIAGNIMADLSSRPMFKESHKEIAAEIGKLAQAFPGGIIPDNQLAAITRDAYFNVVLPKLQANGQSEALADHARRAAASTPRPGGAPSTPAKDTRPVEQQLESHLRSLIGGKRTG